MKNSMKVPGLERFDAWREWTALERRMENLLDGIGRSETSGDFSKGVDFVPACDIDETDSHYLICMDLPGVAKEKLGVEITGHTLRVSGEKKHERESGKGARRAYERYEGRFERSFTLPQVAATENVEADYKDGVLRISIPKSEEAKTKTRKIPVGESSNPLFGKLSRAGEKAA